ncbi:MAG: dienelactone hydrolase family protein [Dongiaceae bacterium]
MDQRIIALYDAFTHGALDRRGFIERLSKLAGGSAAALALIPLLRANKAAAAMIDPADDRLAIAPMSFAGSGGDVRAYVAKPKGGQGLPAVVVIHENRGLNPHIEDVARRMGLAGFLAVAPDFLSPAGGTPADEDKAREMIGALDPQQTVANAKAAVAAARGHADGNGKVGAVGFCWGGGLIGQLAVADPTLDAGVVFYGRAPDPAEVPNIEAPLLLHYAGLDERINAGVPAFQEALDKAGKDYTLYMYDGANHAFHNDTSAARYDKAAAELAWSRTTGFFKRRLAG